MKVRLIAIVSLLAATGLASAHSMGTRTQFDSDVNGVQLDLTGAVGLAFCQGLVNPGPAACGENELGLAFDVTAIDQPASMHYHPFAVGTCEVTPYSNWPGAEYFYVCATDRNDDGLIGNADVCSGEDDTKRHSSGYTNHDECSGESALANGGAGEGWADDWVVGSQDDRVKSFCFQDDVRGFTSADDDDTGKAGEDVGERNQAVPAGAPAPSGWDDVVVFVGVPVYATLPAIPGSAWVTLSIAGASDCGSFNVSAHGTVGNFRSGWDGNGSGPADDSNCGLELCWTLYGPQ